MNLFKSQKDFWDYEMIVFCPVLTPESNQELVDVVS